MSSEITHIGKILAGNNLAHSESALNSDGSRIVIGNWQYDSKKGRARVWERDDGAVLGWKQLGSDIEGFDTNAPHFGGNVAMNGEGDRVILAGTSLGDMKVALVYKYRLVTQAEWDNGTADVDSWDVTKYVIVGKTDNYDAEAKYWVRVGGPIGTTGEFQSNGESVSAVAMNGTGNMIAIGAYRAGVVQAGMVRTYVDSGTNAPGHAWTEIGSISGAADNEEMGSSLSMNSAGDRLVVGGDHYKTSGVGCHVRVYALNGDQWDQRGELNTIMIEDGVDSVGINHDGGRIVVGGSYDDFEESLWVNYGSVRIYNYDGSDYVEDTTFTTGHGTGVAGQKLGYRVCMDESGETVLIGAPNGNPSQGFARVVQNTGGATGTWSTIKEYNGADVLNKAGYGCAMSADGSTYMIGTARTTGNNGHTDIYTIRDIAGTLVDFDSSVVAAATGDIDDIGVGDTDSAVVKSHSALGHVSGEPSFGELGSDKKRFVLRHLLRQAAAKSSRFTLTDTSAFLQFLDTTIRDKIKSQIEVIHPGTLGVELDTSTTSIYCPFTQEGSQMFVDTSTGTERVFIMGLSATADGYRYTLTVDGTPQDMSGHNQEGQVYTYVDTDNSQETTFVWGSATVSTNPISSGGASGDPYIRTVLVN